MFKRKIIEKIRRTTVRVTFLANLIFLRHLEKSLANAAMMDSPLLALIFTRINKRNLVSVDYIDYGGMFSHLNLMLGRLSLIASGYPNSRTHLRNVFLFRRIASLAPFSSSLVGASLRSL